MCVYEPPEFQVQVEVNFYDISLFGRSGFKAVSASSCLFCEEPMLPVLKKIKLERFQSWIRFLQKKQNSSLVHAPTNIVDDHKLIPTPLYPEGSHQIPAGYHGEISTLSPLFGSGGCLFQ